MRESVKRVFPSWLEHWEGCPCDHGGCYPYPDPGGRFTFGIGIAPETPQEAQGYPWRTIGGASATPNDVFSAWAIITDPSNPKNLSASHYASKTTIRLDRSTVDASMVKLVYAFETRASKSFGGYQARPAMVQLAIADMDYNIGQNFADGYPHFVSAVNAGDYREAARQSASKRTPADRLAARAKLLNDAADLVEAGGDLEAISWP